MFAVLKTGGKQYKVASGDVLRVERLAAEAGEKIQFNEVLMLGGDKVTVGTPTVAGAAVQADVIDQIKGEKLIHFVKRRRKHSSKRTKGHRQKLTLVRVTDILASGADKSGVKAAVGTGSLPAADRAALSDAAKGRPILAAAGAVGAAAVAAGAVAAAAQTETAKKATKKVAKAADDVKKAATKTAKKAVEAVSETGTKPSNLLTEARGGKADDLKKISGVGPKLEGLLHDNGVYHFDQIAAWGSEEIAYMDDKLSFKGRIERDNWIEQATQFAAEQE